MAKLDFAEIAELEESILTELPDVITKALCDANRMERLEELLTLLGLSHLLEPTERVQSMPTGRILVVGARQNDRNTFAGVAKSLRIDGGRLEWVSFDEAQKYPASCKMKCPEK